MQTWENVYVFISSTFNDMHAERDYLVKRVFPELSEWCEERKLRLVDIDLRWGVTEKDSQENKRVVEVCLANIDRCRPLFMCFLGQRRGWVPERGDISDATFDAFPKLDDYLGSSVTEMEITHALIDPMLNGSVLELQNRERAFFFMRDPGYLDDITDQNIRNVYTNEAEANPLMADYHMEEFKEQVRETGRPTFEYSATWDARATTPELLAPGKPAGIERGRLTDFRCDGRDLAEIVIEQMKAAIGELYPDRMPAETAAPLQRELDEQARFLQFAQEGFIERAGDFDEIDAFLESDDARPCVIVAGAGMGKTSFLARLVDRLQCDSAHNVMYRFVGTSEGSVSQGSLLMSLADELAARFGVKNVPAAPRKIKETLPTLLGQAAADKPLIVVIDAVNQLDTALDDLSWIPALLPENVKFVYSFKLGEDASDALCARLLEEGETRIVQLRGFEGIEDRESLVSQYLSQYLKELDDDKMAAIVGSTGAENPLFLKVLLSELRVFGSHEGLRDKITSQFGETPKQAFARLLERLETDPVYSPIPSAELVCSLSGWLSHSKNGLEPGELAGLLMQAGLATSGQDARDSVNLLLRQLRAYLAKRDKRLDFFYESFLLASRERYARPEHGGKPDIEWHRDLAAYFQSLGDDDERKTFELAYQHAHAGMGDALVGLLTSFAYLERRVRLSGIQELAQDYALADFEQAGVAPDARQQLALIREALEMAAPMVAKQPTQLAGQLYGRLMGFDLPLIQTLLEDAARTLDARKEPWLKPLFAHLPQPGSRMLRYYKTIRRDGAHLYRDRKRMVVYTDEDQAIKIVEVQTGRVLRSFPLGNRPAWTCLCEDEGVLAVRETQRLRFLNLATGQLSIAEGVEGMYGTAFDAQAGLLVCTGSSSMGNTKTVYVSDVRTGALVDSLSFEDGPPESGMLNSFAVAFDQESELLVMSAESAGFTAYDPRGGLRIVRRFRNYENESSKVRFKYNRLLMPAGTRFLITVTAYDGLNVYDKHTGDVLAHEKLFGLDIQLAVSTDGSLLAFSASTSLKFLSLTTFEIISTIQLDNALNAVTCLAFSSDGHSLYLGRKNGAIEVRSVATGEVANRFDESKEPLFALYPDMPGGLMLAFHQDQVVVWDRDKASIDSDTELFDLPVSSLGIAPDGTFLLVTTASSDGGIYRIDVPSMSCRRLVESNGSAFAYDDVVLSCDGRYFGVMERPSRFSLFNSETGEPAGVIEAVDALRSGDEDSRKIRDPQFLPAALSRGERSLTVLYKQYGYLVMQEPDAPEEARIIRAFPGSVGQTRLFDNQSKLLALSTTQVFDASAGRLKLREDPTLEDGAKVFELANGECIQHTDDWWQAYARSLELDDYPDVVQTIVGSCEVNDKGAKSITHIVRPICRQAGRLVYACEPHYVPGVKDRYNEHTFIVWDSTRNRPVCWYSSDTSSALSDICFSACGKYAFMLTRGALHAFSLENVLDMEPTPKLLRSEQELDHLGFELSRKEGIQLQHKAYLVYSELVERFPGNEHHAKNRGIVERRLKMLLDEMSKANDVAGIEHYFEQYRKLTGAYPGDESYLALLNYAQGKLAFRLSIRNDVASKERACRLYAELVGRHYDEERNQKNLDITQAQIAKLRTL